MSSTNIEVLINSPLCALVNLNENLYLRNYQTRIMASANTYADDCYKNTKSLPARCSIFKKPNIPFVMETTVCPFAGNICSSPSIAFDSGRLDLNQVFRFNLADKDRLKYRKRTTCSILSQEGYVKTVNVSNFALNILGGPVFPGHQVNLYSYSIPRNRSRRPSTWGLSLLGSQLLSEYKLG